MTNDDSKTGKRQPGEYEVGYKRPPAAHRFKPGNAGGPGRPKNARNARTIAASVFLDRKVPLKQNGTTTHVSLLEAMMLRVAERGLANGDPRAIGIAISLLQRTGLLTDQEANTLQDSLTAEDEAQMADWLKKISRGA
jgi:hypothetical protein